MSPQDDVSTDVRLIRLREALSERYGVVRKLGEGGMATVYLADDLRHDRRVALKVLKPELAAIVGAERFLAEIKTTAKLHHPHILQLFDSGEGDGLLYYVMPYVKGESLRDRLARERQLPVDEAVAIARKVASALHTAHQAGIIHRDIKPGNILLAGGEPLVADFGISLALDAGSGQRLTETGLSLGTPQYMSPEQVTGDQSVGPAADVYALGCILYECLSGEPPFKGSTTQAVLAKILTHEPASLTVDRRSVPRNVDAAVQTALEKKAADRFQTVAEFSAALDNEHYRRPVSENYAGSVSTAWSRRRVLMPLAGAAVAVVIVAGALVTWADSREQEDTPHFRVSVGFPDEQALSGAGHFDISADGSTLVYQGVGQSGLTQLWVRRSDAVDATPIAGAEGLSPDIVPDIAISPDAEEVVFFRAGSFHVVPIVGGTPREVADSVWGTSSWSPDGQWIYLRRLASPGISRVPSGGGVPEIITRPDTARGESGHVWPEALPNGEFVLFEARGSSGPAIRAVRLATGEIIDVVEGRYPRYADGHLLFMSEDGRRVMAAPFDPDRLRIKGESRSVITGLPAIGPTATGSYGYAVSQTGILAYAPLRKWTMAWITEDGATRPVDPSWTFPSRPGPWTISPDGTRVAVRIGNAGEGDVWLKVLDEGPETRVTAMAGEERPVAWLDQETLLILAEGASGLDLWAVRADGAGEPRLVYDHPVGLSSATVGGDGSWVAFTTVVQAFTAQGPRGADLFSLRLPSGGPATQLIETTGFGIGGASLDPEARVLAYYTSQSGASEVVVRPFPNIEAGRLQVSVASGSNPVWSPDGSTLYYVNGNREMIAASLVREPLRVTRRALFSLGHEVTTAMSVAATGEFLMASSEPELVLVFNWPAMIK